MCIEILKHARESESSDSSLYIEAIEMCSKRHDVEVATEVLRAMKTHMVPNPQTEKTISILSKLISSKEEILDLWIKEGLIDVLVKSKIISKSGNEPTCDGMLLFASLNHFRYQSVNICTIYQVNIKVVLVLKHQLLFVLQ